MNLIQSLKNDNSYIIELEDAARFESMLAAKNIKFFREANLIATEHNHYPNQTYFFRDEDVKEVDHIIKELFFATIPHEEYNSYFKFEYVLILVAILGLILYFAATYS